MSYKLIHTAALLAAISFSAAAQQPQLDNTDRIRLAEAFRLADTMGNRLWPGWAKAPFAVLLVTADNEFLIRHDKPSADFKLVNYDSILHSNVYVRKRTQPANLLATFPIVGGIPTIVIGQAENTAKKTSTPWVITLLHEHFHQLQYSQSDYYPSVNSLDLTRGDKTGMWMLNYPFPYDWPEMHDHFSLLASRLLKTLQTQNTKQFEQNLSLYLAERRELEHTLSPDDYRYMSFQMWQEGIARYTELRMAQLAANRYKPSKAFKKLKDYKPFSEVALEIKRSIESELATGKIEQSKRVMFYALGAGEGLLLDLVNSGWRTQYFTDKFYLDHYFPKYNRRSHHFSVIS